MLERDAERESKIKEDDFKNMVFANDPKLYNQLFGEESKVIEEEDIEHIVPDTDEDFNKLMRELQNLGVIN